MKNLESIENHLDFLNAHRGTVTREGSFALTKSERPEFTFAYQISPEAKLTETFLNLNQLYLFKDSMPDTKATPGRHWKLSGSITHMNFDPSKAGTPKLRSDLTIQEGHTAQEMEIFGEIQCRSFLTSDAAYASWAPWIKKMNQLNLNSPNQRFLIAFENNDPIAVTLEIIRPQSVGIYAVATHPNHRNKGASTTLLNHTLKSYPGRMICLQVQTSSYAHKFYATLGFQNELEIEIMSLESGKQ